MNHRSIAEVLADRFTAAIATVAGIDPRDVDPVVRVSQDPRFGDYQCNAAMGLAKRLGIKPREVAERIVAAVRLDDVSEPPEIAGPGFVNVRLRPGFLAEYLRSAEQGGPGSRSGGGGASGSDLPTISPSDLPAAEAEDRLGIPPVARPRRTIVEYSSPNIAKEMHVGHLRPTIIGDVLARVLTFLGEEVIRQNHVGDWGTQFGMLIAWYGEHPMPQPGAGRDLLAEFEQDYKAAHARFAADADFADLARRTVGKLQGGDPAARAVWERIYALSKLAFNENYRRLNVLLTDDDLRGESFYNAMLAETIEELREKLPPRDGRPPTPGGPWAEVRDDQGAVCVFFYESDGKPRFKAPDGNELPMIIRKSDGAALYATTDLAALRFRLRELKAERIIYVVGAPQRQHFLMLFATARAAGWINAGVQVEHVPFGMILGEDGKPLKTRTGENVKLRALLDEAVTRARRLVDETDAKRLAEPGYKALSDEEKRRIAEQVGVAAVKYADLSHDRVTDYQFNWDKMLALTGNTAPYMLYAYARIRSIYRKAAERFSTSSTGGQRGDAPALDLSDPTERGLALRLARFREALGQVASDLTPHTLCAYLYDLSADFMRFYEACPVMQAEDEATRLSRMRLCDLTARTLRLGLRLLGIEALERM